MKKSLVLIWMCCLVSFLQAQSKNLPSKKLVEQYAAIYSKTDPKHDFYTRMSAAANNLFLVNNLPIYEAIDSLLKQNRITVDSAANLIFDTIIHSFVRHHLWDDHPGEQEKFLAFFQMYNGRLCPCLTEKIQQAKMREDTAMNYCIGKLITDTTYITETKRLLGPITLPEAQNISQLSGIFIFQNCDVMYRYFSESMRYESVYQLLGNLRDWLFRLDEKIIEMYNLKSKDLTKIFPSFKSFEPDLKLSAALLKTKHHSKLHNREENADGSLTIINTYYNYTNDKAQLLGQIIFKMKEPFFTAPIVSWRFATPAKIKDRSKYLKQIEDEQVLEPPPPSMLDELRNIKIDTLKNK